MALSREDIQQIAKAVTDTYPVIDRRSEFFIEPKAHYDQHQRIDRLLDMFESSASTVWKTVLVFAVVGLIGLIVLGFKMKA